MRKASSTNFPAYDGPGELRPKTRYTSCKGGQRDAGGAPLVVSNERSAGFRVRGVVQLYRSMPASMPAMYSLGSGRSICKRRSLRHVSSTFAKSSKFIARQRSWRRAIRDESFEVRAVAAFSQRFGQAKHLLGVDETERVRDLLRASDLQALARLERLDEGSSLH